MIRRRAVLAGLSALAVPAGPSLGQGGTSPAAAEGPLVLRAIVQPRKLAPADPGEAELWLLGEPAPAIRIRHGERLRAELRNETPKPLSLHWHGVRAPNDQDGVGGLTGPPVPPGGTGLVDFVPPDPGTFLIRPLVLGASSEPAGRGIGGILVVEEREPPPVAGDHAVLVRDWLVEPSGALPPFGDPREAALGGRLGNRLHAGGRAAPERIEAPAGSRLRLRLVNGCGARAMRIRFDDLRVYVAAVDGQPTDTFEPLRASLPFGPGSRYDILLDVPDAPGRVTALVGPGLPLVEIVPLPRDAAAPSFPPIAPLPPNGRLPPEIKLQNAVRRTVAITGGAARDASGAIVFPPDPKAIWKLNGAAGAVASPPLFTARRGQPVVLGITNATALAQPLHLHGHVFRLLHPLDDGWEPYFLDTVQVPEGRTIQIAFLADNPGRWLLGSAVPERLDTGLWTTFEVS